MKKKSFPIREYTVAAVTGGVAYSFLEILWRGYTHWSMILAGALAAILLYGIREHCRSVPLSVRCLLGTAGITLVEFGIGCVVNLWWGLEVWDYSDMPFNLFGQICPTFSVLWFFLCLPAYWLCGQIRNFCRSTEESRPLPQKKNGKTGQTAV